jgi:hypothetical protein
MQQKTKFQITHFFSFPTGSHKPNRKQNKECNSDNLAVENEEENMVRERET